VQERAAAALVVAIDTGIDFNKVFHEDDCDLPFTMKTIAVFALLALLFALAAASPFVDSADVEDFDLSLENDSDVTGDIVEMADYTEDDDGMIDMSDDLEANCKCFIGSQLLSNGRCSRCAIAYYNDVCGGKCKLCPDGKTTLWEATKSVEGCVCSRNSFWNSQSKKCDACPFGTYFTGSTSKPQATSASDCLPCPAGTEVLKNNQGCRECGQGTFSASQKSASCKPCPVGTIAPNVGSTECTVCPVGTISFNVFGKALGRKDMGTKCCPTFQYNANRHTCS
jgi:hypothetical protein